MSVEIFRSILGANTSFKSTVLKSLAGMAFLLIGGIILASKFSYEWLVILFAVCFAILFICFMFTYLYCLIKNPNLLRSERHTEQMQAMEKGFYLGDATSGIKLLNSQSGDNKATSGTQEIKVE